MPGLVWVEVAYMSPHSSDGGTFIFVGDVVSMARSVRLTMYRPRLNFHFATYLPDVLERILLCLFHASLALALLNSLPVSWSPSLGGVPFCAIGFLDALYAFIFSQ